MPKSAQTPVSVLKDLMDEYQLSSYALAKAINLSISGVRQIAVGKSKVSVPTALRLAKFFGQTPDYWLDLQREADLNEAKKDEELQSVLKGISKAKKPKSEPKAKAGRKTAVQESYS
jgi:addiction module HigA family antidote